MLAVRTQRVPDLGAEHALAAVWQGRLARLADGNPELRADLQRLLAEDLAPLSPRPEQGHVTGIQQNA